MQELQSSLSVLFPLIQPFLNGDRKKLIHLSRIGTVTVTLSSLADQWEWFSLVFYSEKDNLNLAFRSLMEIYAIAIALDYQDVSFYFIPAV